MVDYEYPHRLVSARRSRLRHCHNLHDATGLTSTSTRCFLQVPYTILIRRDLRATAEAIRLSAQSCTGAVWRPLDSDQHSRCHVRKQANIWRITCPERGRHCREYPGESVETPGGGGTVDATARSAASAEGDLQSDGSNYPARALARTYGRVGSTAHPAERGLGCA